MWLKFQAKPLKSQSNVILNVHSMKPTQFLAQKIHHITIRFLHFILSRYCCTLSMVILTFCINLIYVCYVWYNGMSESNNFCDIWIKMKKNQVDRKKMETIWSGCCPVTAHFIKWSSLEWKYHSRWDSCILPNFRCNQLLSSHPIHCDHVRVFDSFSLRYISVFWIYWIHGYRVKVTNEKKINTDRQQHLIVHPSTFCFEQCKVIKINVAKTEQKWRYIQNKWKFQLTSNTRPNQNITTMCRCVCLNDGNDYTQTINVAIFFSLSLFTRFSPSLTLATAGLTVHAITSRNWLVEFGITCFNAIKIQMNRIQLNTKRPTNRYSAMFVSVSLFISSFPSVFHLWFWPINVIVVVSICSLWA